MTKHIDGRETDVLYCLILRWHLRWHLSAKQLAVLDRIIAKVHALRGGDRC